MRGPKEQKLQAISEAPQIVIGNSGENINFLATIITAIQNNSTPIYSQYGDAHLANTDIVTAHWKHLTYPKFWKDYMWYSDTSKKIFVIDIDFHRDIRQVALNHIVKRLYQNEFSTDWKRWKKQINRKRLFPHIKTNKNITNDVLEWAIEDYILSNKKHNEIIEYDRKGNPQQFRHLCRRLFIQKWRDINANWVTIINYRDMFNNHRKFIMAIEQLLGCIANPNIYDVCKQYVDKNIAMGKIYYPQLNILTGQLNGNERIYY